MSHPTIPYLLALPSRVIGKHPIADTPSVLIAVLSLSPSLLSYWCVCVCAVHVHAHEHAVCECACMQRQYDRKQTLDAFLHCSSPYCLETGTLTVLEPSHSG